jgi:peptide/nickel transport system ATP-binding protein
VSIIDRALAKKGRAADPEGLLQEAPASAAPFGMVNDNSGVDAPPAPLEAPVQVAAARVAAPAADAALPIEPPRPVTTTPGGTTGAVEDVVPTPAAHPSAKAPPPLTPLPPEPGRIEPVFGPVPAARPVLVVEDLRVSFPNRDGGRFEAVRGVSFTLGRERLGIVGESGSGKSQTGRAILGLTAPEGRVTARRLEFHGTDLLRCSARERRDLRGGRIAMVLQDPKFSLNPVMTIGDQVVETLRAHSRISARDARAKALQALAAVQIDQPERVYKLYPHEVSGGMGQRAMIAMMLIADPELLIADEPTSALDVTVQLQVLGIMDKLVTERGMGLVFISHDLRLVSTFCDRILVMYAGKIVEEVSSGALADAKHPYTRGLLNCLPNLGDDRHPLPTLDRRPEWAV